MKSKSTLRRPTLMVQVITCLCLLALTPLASAERFNTFYHTDHLGNVMGASDDDGVYTPSVGDNYESYGDSGRYSRPDPSNPAYTGKKFDPHTGLYYFGGRYYDPDAKRFISPDPMAYSPGNPISFNRYAYANNNPLRYIDPDGANAVTAFGGLIYESAQFVSGHGFNGSNVLGALADGYNGEGSGLARAAIDDALTFFPLGAVTGAAVKFGYRAAKSGSVAIGRVKDLQKLKKGEKSLLDRLPDQGSPKANWKQNSGVLRQEMGKSKPIRDASPGDTSGQFLNAERNLLESHGWSFDKSTNYWNPPK
jgi:RHS repeat-associated protein